MGLLSCTPSPGGEPGVHAGRTVVLFNYTDAELCGATVETLDGFVEAALGELGVEPPAEPFITYRWENEEGMENSPCPRGATAVRDCARQDDEYSTTIYSRSPYHLHELAHAIHFYSLPDSMPVLQEGFAELIADADPPLFFTPYQDNDLQARLGASVEQLDYGLAHALVYATVLNYDLSGLISLWLSLPPESTGAELAQAYQDLFGEDVEGTVQSLVFNETSFFPRLMVSCAQPTVDETATAPLEIQAPPVCSKSSVGPHRGQTIETRILHVVNPGTYRISLLSGECGTATLLTCDLATSGSGLVLGASTGFPESSSELLPGEYLLKMSSHVDCSDTEPATFLLERVE